MPFQNTNYAASSRIVATIASTLLGATRRSRIGEFENLNKELAEFLQRLEPRPGESAETQLQDSELQQIRQLAAALQSRKRPSPNASLSAATSGSVILFTGPSGTGKTTAAQTLAHELGSTVFRVDSRQVASRYIGETEKNLEKIIDSAEASQSILFFDEADGLFGKRSDVKDSHDRFTNMEANSLLQRANAHPAPVIFACEKPIGLLDSIAHVIEFHGSTHPR